MAPKRNAFSLVELVIVVVFLSIFAYITVPKIQLSVSDKYKRQTLAQKIVTGLRFARNLAITDAADNTAGYSFSMVDAAPYKSYRIVNLSNNAVVASYMINSSMNVTGGAEFKFGPLGNLLTGSDTELIVSASGRNSKISVTAATGAVSCVEN